MTVYQSDYRAAIKAEKEKHVGKRYGHLVVEQVFRDPNYFGKSVWMAIGLCDCGNRTLSRLFNITSGGCNSCGCARRVATKHQRMTWRCKETGHTYTSTTEMVEHSGIGYSTAVSKAKRGFDEMIGLDGRTYVLVGPTADDEPRRNTVNEIKRARRQRHSSHQFMAS